MKILILTIVLFFSIILIVLNLGFFFDITKVATKSDIILCLGGGKGDRIKKSIDLLNNNFSKNNLIYSSDDNQKDRNIKLSYLEKYNSNIIFTNFVSNTYNELFLIKKIMIENKFNSVLIVTTPPHSRRVNFLINQYVDFKSSNLTYTVVSSSPEWWNKKYYYKNNKAINFVIHEIFKLTYNLIDYSIFKYFSFEESTLFKIDELKKTFTKKLNKLLHDLQVNS
jgi:hypothetical protein